MTKITLVIADDQVLTREGLRTILNLEEDMEVVGLAKNGEEACRMAEEHRPTLVLLDIQMPVMDGISALKRIQQSCPDTRILILTTFIDTDYIVEGLANGANGYLLKDMVGDKMISSIRDTVNARVGEQLIHEVLIDQINFLSKDEIRNNTIRRRRGDTTGSVAKPKAE